MNRHLKNGLRFVMTSFLELFTEPGLSGRVSSVEADAARKRLMAQDLDRRQRDQRDQDGKRRADV